MHRHLRSRLLYLLGVISLLAVLLPVSAPTSASHTLPLSVKITYVRNVDTSNDGIEDRTSGKADMYAGVTIDGQKFNSFNGHPDDHDELFLSHLEQLNWNFSKQVPGESTSYPVKIEIWDHDDCDVPDQPFCSDDDVGVLESGDDQGDVQPGGDAVLDLNVTQDGKWTGDVNWPQNCAQGEGQDSVQVCWEISTDSNGGDADFDGLLDSWERFGYNADGDGDIDVDLPGFGAKWNHQNLFLELDYSSGEEPSRADIQAIKRAFAAAPRTNLDNVGGITLFIDTGNLVDPTAREGQVPNTCSDGIDNGSDTQTDGADQDCTYLDSSVEDPQPGNCANNLDDDGDGNADEDDLDCLVGDNLGGGNYVRDMGTCGLDQTFYDVKNGFTNAGVAVPGNFDSARKFIFRYAISSVSDIDIDGNGPDTGCVTGGEGEIGGNDFIDFNNDGGTIMHELGHNLNLRHGGNVDDNCKPNYVSVMNYDLQFGIPRVGGGTILDYSPPRIATTGATRGNAPLRQLDEGNLDETAPALDASDTSNRFTFVDGLGVKNTINLNAQADWDGIGGTTNNNVPPTNINTAGPIPPGSPAGTTGSPAGCATNMSNTDILNGFNDWNQVSLPFRQFGDSANSAINPENHPIPTSEELERITEAINTADVSIAITASPSPVGAGEQLTYTVTAANQAGNPASSIEVRVSLPADVTFVDTSITSCAQSGNVVTCNLGELLEGGSRSVDIRVDVPADLVYTNGGPKTITASATVDNLAGPDPNSGNDNASVDTLVITKADIKITGVTTTSPLEVLIGQQASTTIDVTVENGGPSTPVDTILTGAVTADTGLTVAPAATTANQTALAKGTPQVERQSFTLDCVTPGYKTVAFAYEIELSTVNDANAVDPDLNNNTATASFTIDCVVPIAINVRPKGFPNSINLNTDATLAALTTTAGEYGLPLAFDATTIDPLATHWGVRSSVFNVGTVAGATEIHAIGHLERSYELDEKTRDSDLDMVLHFKPAASGLTITSTEACLKGSFLASDGNTYRFLGCDAVRVLP